MERHQSRSHNENREKPRNENTPAKTYSQRLYRSSPESRGYLAPSRPGSVQSQPHYMPSNRRNSDSAASRKRENRRNYLKSTSGRYSEKIGVQYPKSKTSSAS